MMQVDRATAACSLPRDLGWQAGLDCLGSCCFQLSRSAAADVYVLLCMYCIMEHVLDPDALHWHSLPC